MNKEVPGNHAARNLQIGGISELQRGEDRLDPELQEPNKVQLQNASMSEQSPHLRLSDYAD
jgi:hypothetical protein